MEELVQHDLARGIALELDHDAHAVPGGSGSRSESEVDGLAVDGLAVDVDPETCC